jgi:ketosteroid isomerase-like protein
LGGLLKPKIQFAVAMLILVGIAVATFSAPRWGTYADGGRAPLLRPPQTALPADGALLDLLSKQAAAWNGGDIEGFMQGYWRSEKLTFSGSSGVSRGWQAVLDRYHRNYPDRAAMGHLDFSEIEITPLGNDAALILGKWHLDRESGPVGGVFTLVAQRFPEGWRIIHDHTSSVAADNHTAQ